MFVLSHSELTARLSRGSFYVCAVAQRAYSSLVAGSLFNNGDGRWPVQNRFLVGVTMIPQYQGYPVPYSPPRRVSPWWRGMLRGSARYPRRYARRLAQDDR